MVSYTRHPASFKDPSGFVFEADGKFYRQVNQFYAPQYRQLMDSGLYAQLVKHKHLVSHEEIDVNFTQDKEWFKTINPESVNYISYPYEWCFAQLKDAALLTLKILRTSLDYGMILKDATPFNIQFHNGKAVFIDTLSFDTYDPKQPWIAYRQFCQCFLFPLYLEHYLKSDIQKILSTYINGIPVEIIAKLLPLKSRLNLGVWLHVYLQNTTTATVDKDNKASVRFSKKKLTDLISHLETIINNFPADKPFKTTWSNYYDDTRLSKEYVDEKEKIILDMVGQTGANTVLDLGANTGHFSKKLASQGMMVVATDTDSRCINQLYLDTTKKDSLNILPLVVDVANPSPAIGFNNRERAAFHERIQTELVLALALIHHLVIGRNIPLGALASYFHRIAPQLIIEFPPKTDPKVKQMLSSRPDVFMDYNQEHFESVFSNYFTIADQIKIPGTERILYRMIKK
jgi:hypothetical protein